jgi:hypothetical protein
MTNTDVATHMARRRKTEADIILAPSMSSWSLTDTPDD